MGYRSTVAKHYAFGDTEQAAQRLGVLAEIFDPASEAFLADQVSAPPRLAVDLGCGPGHSTRLLARVTGATRIVGLDSSENFLAAARQDAPDGLEFRRHDVRDIPWPVAGADLAFARLVLAHLSEPHAGAMGWLTQLAPGGLLALDELDPAPLGWRRASTVRTWNVAIPRVAAMFRLNLAVWRRDPLVPVDQAELDELSDRLDALTTGQTGGTMTWGLRQVVFQHR